MTTRESAASLRGRRRIVVIANYDEYIGDAFCPLCGSLVSDEVGTPSVPVDALGSTDVAADEVPAYGWRCDCRRAEIAVLAPAEVAPENYTPVEHTADGETTTIAVPTPVLEVACSDDHE